MIGPYTANDDRTIFYRGNKVFQPVSNIQNWKLCVGEVENRVQSIKSNNMWIHIARINHQIYKSANDFFDDRGCVFIPLPLSTRMISSPGAVYGKEAINYTTDTCPIRIKWFDLEREAFLAESSQIYLELALLQDKGLKGVYAVYNSFRKEKVNYTHLSEFHHIEFEGKCTQKENLEIALRFIGKIITDLLEKNMQDLQFFLNEKKIVELKNLAEGMQDVPKITFSEALEALRAATGDKKYLDFSQKNFGAWEEIKLTEIYKNLVVVTEFPLLEVPFYHAEKKGGRLRVANNADIIWPGYREVLGGGQRITSLKELKEKAKIFNLPEDDYAPYLQSRQFEDYETTSGFGLGWERLLQGILEMPTIVSVCHFPRTDITLKP